SHETGSNDEITVVVSRCFAGKNDKDRKTSSRQGLILYYKLNRYLDIIPFRRRPEVEKEEEEEEEEEKEEEEVEGCAKFKRSGGDVNPGVTRGFTKGRLGALILLVQAFYLNGQGLKLEPLA
ncbi:hypothetical protein V1478_011808, partial [Vespula squamosa]